MTSIRSALIAPGLNRNLLETKRRSRGLIQVSSPNVLVWRSLPASLMISDGSSPTLLSGTCSRLT